MAIVVIDKHDGEALKEKFHQITKGDIWEYITNYCSINGVSSFTISSLIDFIKTELQPNTVLKKVAQNEINPEQYLVYRTITKILFDRIESFLSNTTKNKFSSYNSTTKTHTVNSKFRKKETVLNHFRKSPTKSTATKKKNDIKQESQKNGTMYVSFPQKQMQIEETHEQGYLELYQNAKNAFIQLHQYSESLPLAEREKLNQQYPFSNLLSIFSPSVTPAVVTESSPQTITIDSTIETKMESVTLEDDANPKISLKRKRETDDEQVEQLNNKNEIDAVDAMLSFKENSTVSHPSEDGTKEAEPKTKKAKYESNARRMKTKFKLISLDAKEDVKTQKSTQDLLANSMQDLSTDEIDIYVCDEEEDLKKLEKDSNSKIIYNKKSNAQNADKVFLAPVAVLQNQLGAFAKVEIKKGSKPFAVYAGEKIPATNCKHAGAYCFQIMDQQNKIVGYVDAESIRDFSGFFNHSETPNLYAEQEEINGESVIVFYLARDIHAYEQLTFNYKRGYFNELGIKPFYMHSTDNWMSDAQKYNESDPQKFYLKDKYTFDKQTREELELGDCEWLIPNLFKFIIENNDASLSMALTSNQTNPDVLAYACEGNVMYQSSEQQHLTALMLACYLGRGDCIKTLIEANADINRCMLLSGDTPLTLLLRGRAKDIQMIESVGLQLLNSMSYPFAMNKNELNILHYAILRGAPKLVERILKISEDHPDVDLLATMYDSNQALPDHANFDYCVKEKQFPILKLLLNWALTNKKEHFRALLKAGEIFSEEFLKQIPLSNVKALYDLLSKKPFFQYMNEQGVLERLDTIINQNKVQKRFRMFQPVDKKEKQSTKPSSTLSL